MNVKELDQRIRPHRDAGNSVPVATAKAVREILCKRKDGKS
jgi:hypothetical protein